MISVRDRGMGNGSGRVRVRDVQIIEFPSVCGGLIIGPTNTKWQTHILWQTLWCQKEVSVTQCLLGLFIN